MQKRVGRCLRGTQEEMEERKQSITVWSKVKVKSLSRVQLFATPWTVAHQAPPPMGFSRQEYWNGLPNPSPGNFPDSGIKLRSPTLQAEALTSEPSTEFLVQKHLPTHCKYDSNHMTLWKKQNYGDSGTSQVVQWLRLWAPNAGWLASIPGRGTRSHMPQLKLSAAKENK